MSQTEVDKATELVERLDRAAGIAPLRPSPQEAEFERQLAQLAAFDLSHLNYDVVGRIFERLIEPQERYRR